MYVYIYIHMYRQHIYIYVYITLHIYIYISTLIPPIQKLWPNEHHGVLWMYLNGVQTVLRVDGPLLLAGLRNYS